MKILFLDDDITRCEIFKKIYPDATIVHTAKECIDILSNNNFDLLFLDHDLGNRIYVDENDDNCGTYIVKWMIDNNYRADDIVIHSMNIPAATNMSELLRTNDYNVINIPFSTLIDFIQDLGNDFRELLKELHT